MVIDVSKSIEQIEKKVWAEPEYHSQLALTCHRLRKKPLKDFTIEDLRLLIGQNMNPELLIPLALEELKENLLAEGDYYPGDLLYAVISCDPQYWQAHKDLWKAIKDLYDQHCMVFESDDSYKQIRKAFDSFSTLNG